MSKYSFYSLSALSLATLAVAILPGSARAFGFNDVVAKAKALAAKPYVAPKAAPSFLANLDYNEFRKIRFDPKQSLWHQSHSTFQVMLVAPGLYFKHIVNIHVVDAAGVHQVPFKKDWFSWPKKLEAKIPDDLGYAGFKLTYPLNDGPNVQNQFLVFAGVSYFRGVARGENFGLSARGIAVDTGLASGEEFPIFTDYWLVRPSPKSHVLRFFALLNGPSLTGAYEFLVTPGAPTQVKVKASLFVRKDITLLGFAPLTSMFYYGQNTPRPAGQWRAAVHDSDGLLIHSSSGEWLWRPLINPINLSMDYFEADSPKGFGLLQRDRHFRDYQDAGARYDTRPSAWITPHNDWGNGHVVLVEIPTDTEINDNIVAFWSPDKAPKAGDHYDLSYTLDFGGGGITGEPLARAVNSFVGNGGKTNVYRFVVDFKGGPLAKLKPNASVQADVSGLNGAKILQQTVDWVQPLGVWRVSFLAQEPAGKPLDLRAFLKSGDQTLSETWSYELPSPNRIPTHATPGS
ncbi:MAG: glucan biosynthesis protein G [Gammaproteobacteria bacterium]